MAFKLTYSDGQESDYGDDTAWEVEAGVLKLGREEGNWTVLLSPSHWAVIEVGGATAETVADGEDAEDSSDSEDSADSDDSDGEESDEPAKESHGDSKD